MTRADDLWDALIGHLIDITSRETRIRALAKNLAGEAGDRLYLAELQAELAAISSAIPQLRRAAHEIQALEQENERDR